MPNLFLGQCHSMRESRELPVVVCGAREQAPGQEGRRRLHCEKFCTDLKNLGFYSVHDLELLKDFKERTDKIRFAFGKILMATYWKVDWRRQVVQ